MFKCFQVQFKVLIVTLKALHGYLWGHLFPMVPSQPISSNSRGIFWVSCERMTFCVIAPALEPLHSRNQTLIEEMKIWHCHQVWGCDIMDNSFYGIFFSMNAAYFFLKMYIFENYVYLYMIALLFLQYFLGSVLLRESYHVPYPKVTRQEGPRISV